MKRTLFVASVAACLVVSTLRGSSHAESNRLFGVYLAVVKSNQDPSQRGLILLKFPALPGTSSTTELWARPSVPYVDGTIGSIKLPPPGAAVWVEFEAGDPTFPVWVGWMPR